MEVPYNPEFLMRRRRKESGKGGNLKGFSIIKRVEEAINNMRRSHPTEHVLKKFYYRKLDLPGTVAVLSHVRACSDCVDTLLGIIIEDHLTIDGQLSLNHLEPLPHKLRDAIKKKFGEK